MKSNQLQILFIISLSLANVAQALQCTQLFAVSQNRTLTSNYIGVSLNYSPALEINGQSKYFDNQVFIESFLPGQKIPFKQKLEYYVHPVYNIAMSFGKTILHEAGLKAIYKNYGPRVDPEIVQKVISIEASLPLNRQATFITGNKELNETYSFVRIFEGTSENNNTRRGISRSLLPLEIILQSMNKNTNAVTEIRKTGVAVFEVGKYFITDGLDLQKAKLIKSDMFRWLIEQLETRGAKELETSVYFAHVASQIHKIAYQRAFGFEVVDPAKSDGLAADESLLKINGAQLLKNLKLRLESLEK